MDGQVKVIEACEADEGKEGRDERGRKRPRSHMEVSHTRGWAREQYIAGTPHNTEQLANTLQHPWV